MKPLSWLAGVLLYLAFLIATAPASTLLWLTGHFVAPGIAANTTTGTLWRGEAHDVSFTPPGGQAIRLAHLSWHIHPFGLAFGQPLIEIEFGDAAARGQIALNPSLSELDIARLDATLPAAWLARIQPGLETFRLEGTLTLRGKDLSLNRRHFQGQGEILWNDAALGLSPVKPVGNYRGEFNGGGDGIQFRLYTLNGPLELAGSGEWSKPGGVHFSGTARARERENELAPVLRLLGKADSNGFYAVKF